MNIKTMALVFTLILSTFLGAWQQKTEAASGTVINSVDKHNTLNTSKYLLVQNDDNGSDDGNSDDGNSDDSGSDDGSSDDSGSDDGSSDDESSY